MKFLNLTLLALTFNVITQAAFAYEPVVSTDRDEINTSCSKDGKNAHCARKLVGKDLLMCIKNYQKKHSDFVLSEGCTASINQFKDDKQKSDQ